MLNLKGFLIKILKHIRRYKGKDWDLISEEFYKILKSFINKKDKILEFGSNTGHISYRLAKEGYNLTLLDIRIESIEEAKRIFSENKIKAKFICCDILKHNNKYDFAWNSGLIQCYKDKEKKLLIRKIASITDRMLLFYPDTEDVNKKRGKNKYNIPGVGDAKEYGIKRIVEITYIYFNKIYFGVIKKEKGGLDYDMYWLYAYK